MLFSLFEFEFCKFFDIFIKDSEGLISPDRTYIWLGKCILSKDRGRRFYESLEIFEFWLIVEHKDI